jgi:hypothetical protein
MLFVGVSLAVIAAVVVLSVKRFNRVAELYDHPLRMPVRHAPGADGNSG